MSFRSLFLARKSLFENTFSCCPCALKTTRQNADVRLYGILIGFAPFSLRVNRTNRTVGLARSCAVPVEPPRFAVRLSRAGCLYENCNETTQANRNFHVGKNNNYPWFVHGGRMHRSCNVIDLCSALIRQNSDVREKNRPVKHVMIRYKNDA